MEPLSDGPLKLLHMVLDVLVNGGDLHKLVGEDLFGVEFPGLQEPASIT